MGHHCSTLCLQVKISTHCCELFVLKRKRLGTVGHRDDLHDAERDRDVGGDFCDGGSLI